MKHPPLTSSTPAEPAHHAADVVPSPITEADKAAVRDIECPGPDCKRCNGEGCDKCGAGFANDAPYCEHDGIERHEPRDIAEKPAYLISTVGSASTATFTKPTSQDVEEMKVAPQWHDEHSRRPNAKPKDDKKQGSLF